MPQFRESRVDVANVPLLGGLFRPPLAKRFQGAQAVASVVLVGNMLALLPSVKDFPASGKIIISHRNLSWEPPGKARAVTMDDLPSIPALSQLPVIGRVFRSPKAPQKDLLVIIHPSVIADPES